MKFGFKENKLTMLLSIKFLLLCSKVAEGELPGAGLPAQICCSGLLEGGLYSKLHGSYEKKVIKTIIGSVNMYRTNFYKKEAIASFTVIYGTTAKFSVLKMPHWTVPTVSTVPYRKTINRIKSVFSAAAVRPTIHYSKIFKFYLSSKRSIFSIAISPSYLVGVP